MRICLALVLGTFLVTLASCGGEMMHAIMGGDDSTGDDAPIDATPAGDSGPKLPSVQLSSPVIDFAPNSDLTYCYYFDSANTDQLAVQRWDAQLSSSVQYAILYLTPSDLKTPQTLTTDACDYSANGFKPAWTFAAQANGDSLVMPSNDGNGQPIDMPLPAGKPGYLEMHLVNPTNQVTHEQVAFTATGYPAGTATTDAGTYVTYSLSINIGPGSPAAPTLGMAGGNCTVDKSLQFFALTTHTNKQGTEATIKDGAAALFDKVMPKPVPPIETFAYPSYKTFTSGKLSYQCTYSNPNNYQLVNGDDAKMDEVCRAIGYFFPSPGGDSKFCGDSTVFE